MKRITILLALLVLLLCGCGGQTTDEPIGTCTVSINCATLLDNMDNLTPGKAELVPEDGVLLAQTTVELYEGDTGYSLLQRFFQQQKLHYEFTGSNSSAYLSGLCNLYEFDCGSLSGWEFSVNGEFPSIGVGGYTLADGDEIRLLYTCDLGLDVGDLMDE